MAIEDNVVAGRHADCDVVSDAAGISDKHATFHIRDAEYFVVDQAGSSGTWLNGKKVTCGAQVQLHPGDMLGLGDAKGEGRMYKVKQMHVSQRDAGLLSANNDGTPRRYKVSWREERGAAALA